MGGGGGGRLFEAERLLTFSAFRMGTYSRWALIRDWALIRINTVCRMCAYYIHQVLMFVERKCTLHFNPCKLVNTTEKLGHKTDCNIE